MIKESKALREIHEIMEKSFEERKNMSTEELLSDMHKSSDELINKYNIKLRHLERGRKKAA